MISAIVCGYLYLQMWGEFAGNNQLGAFDESGELRVLYPTDRDRRFGDFSAAEDAVQEALLAAAMQWPREGVPENPRGWLIQVAARRCTDHLRAELARRRREAIVMTSPDEQIVVPEGNTEHDDTLLLLFMCCHPALTRASAIALTLRAVGGLTTAEIASAFLVPEATMAQTDQPGEAADQSLGRAVRDARWARARGAARRRAARTLSDLQ